MSQLTSIGPELPLPRSQAYRDWLGVGASVLCAIHCAAMPFVVGFLPLLGLSFLADPSFHQWMVAICLALALLAFVPGWRRHHRLAPAIIGLAGLGLITFAAFAGPEDCCPTPCDGSATTTDGTAMTVAMPGPAPCAMTCCDTAGQKTGESSTGPTLAVTDLDAGGKNDGCAAPCCSTASPSKITTDAASKCVASCCENTSTPPPAGNETMAAVSTPESAACTAACCPDEGETVLTAGTSDFMALVWLWMTPIGGLILVVAHLTNHRLSAHCKRACCAAPTKKSATS